MSYFRGAKAQDGQILLIVILTMIVALTVGLSIASRTITNLKISTQNEESQRAFQAAEAGIEQALRSGTGTPGESELSNAVFTATVEEVEDAIVALNGGGDVDQSRGIDFWLAEYNEDPALAYQNPWSGTIRINWGNVGQDCSETEGVDVPPALELVLLSGTKTSPSVTKYLLDPCVGRIQGASNVITPTTGPYSPDADQQPYLYRATLTPITSGLIMKIVPLYNSGRVVVESTTGNTFPPQGRLIESVGKSGDTERKIQYFETYPQIPNEIFPYTIVSQ